jgi:hypothetical protein
MRGDSTDITECKEASLARSFPRLEIEAVFEARNSGINRGQPSGVEGGDLEGMGLTETK